MESLGITIKVGEDRTLADEVYSLVGSIGFKKYTSYYPTKSSPWVYTNNNGNIMHCSFKADNDIEVDINQLRDLVVLKRNDVGDAQYVDTHGFKIYKSSDNKLYYFEHRQFGNKQYQTWVESAINGHYPESLKDDYLSTLKPIEKEEMKQQEYLVKNADGKYFLTTSSNYPDGIKVPEGAEIYALASDGNYSFWNDEYQWADDGEITRDIKEENPKFTFKEWSLGWDAKILWQRNNPEELKSISFDLGAEGGDETKITTIENPLFPDFELSEPVIESNDFNGLDKSEINYCVAKAFNAIRGTDLNEDDIHFLRELIDLTTSHYWDRK